MAREIRTTRLLLRAPVKADAAAIARLVGDFEVARWLTAVPHPYTTQDALDFVSTIAGDEDWVVLVQGKVAGVVGTSDGLGYWLGRPFWGKGYMSEAAQAIVRHHFAGSADTLPSGHFPGNVRSRRILAGLGFRDTMIEKVHARALGHTVDLQGMELTRDAWLAADPLHIRTDRLVIRPYESGDVDGFHAGANHARVARMMASLPHPLDRDTARTWIADRQYRGRPGFCLGVFLPDGRFVGNLGMGGTPVSVMYFIDPAQWGRGYATEALAAFLAEIADRFALSEVTAEVMVDNPASARVLEKLGFACTGRGVCTSLARLEAQPNMEYRLGLHASGTPK